MTTPPPSAGPPARGASPRATDPSLAQREVLSAPAGQSASASATPAGPSATRGLGSGPGPHAEPEPAPHRWAALFVLALGVGLVVIDGTIVNVALPTIIRELTLSFSQAQWVGAGYALVLAGLLLLSGTLGDLLGRRTLFAIGVVVFIGASLLAGSADGSGSFLAARAVQGMGAAAILPSTLSTVNATFRGRERAHAFGIWGAVIAGSAAVGPLLGGALTTHISWRWVFWINLPLGLLLLLGAALFVPNTRGGHGRPGIDMLGAILSFAGVGGLVLGLVEGRVYGWWQPLRPAEIGGLTWPMTAPVSLPAVALGVGAVGLVTFALWELRRESRDRPVLLRLGLWRYPSFAWGNIAALLIALGEFGLLFVLPLYLQRVLGLSALGAGWVLAAMAFGAFLAGAQARHLAVRIGPADVATLGLALEVVGVLGLAALVTPTRSAWVIAATLVVYGLGLGLCSAQLTSVVLSQVPPHLSGQGSAAQSTVRQLGAALGVAVLATLLGATIGVGDEAIARVSAQVMTSGTRVTMAAAGGVLAVGLIATLRLPRTPRHPHGSTQVSVPAPAGTFEPRSETTPETTSETSAEATSETAPETTPALEAAQESSRETSSQTTPQTTKV